MKACMNTGMKTKSTFLSKKNLSLDPLAPFGSAPFLTHSKKGARSKKGQTKNVSSFHGNTRRNGDGTWKGGVDSSMIPNADCPDDDDFYSNVQDDEFYYASDYSCVCTVDNKSTRASSFYQSHWLIDSGASDHITPYLEDFSHILLGEQLASTTNGSIIQMHGPGTIVLKQDTPKAPIVRLTGVWYAPEAAHRLLSVTALTSQGFSCKITDKTKIWDKQGKLVIQASALLSSTPLHWFRSKLIIPEGAVYSLQENNSYHLWHLRLGHTSKNTLHYAHKHLKGISTLQEPVSDGPCKGCQLGKAHE